MFKLDILKKPNPKEFSKDIAIGGIEITLTVKKDIALTSAIHKVFGKVDNKAVTFEDLKRDNQGVSIDYAMLYMIGEYMINKWNVADKDGNPLAVNGDNFMLLLDVLPNDISNEVKDLATTEAWDLWGKLNAKAEDVVKKPSTATSGKPKKQN